MEIILGIAFLILGVVFFLYLRKPAGPSPDAQPASNPVPGPNESNQEKPSNEDVLTPVTVPDNFPEVVFLFGSQTGTAERFCKQLEEEAKTHGIAARSIDMEDLNFSELPTYPLVVIMSATYGEGDPTDNAVKFTKWLKEKVKSGETELLKSVNFSCFGLGNTQYEQYNFMGKFFNETFEKLGAERIYTYGEGDDDKCLEDDFKAWKKNLWLAFTEYYAANLDKISPIERKNSVTERKKSLKEVTINKIITKKLATKEEAKTEENVTYELVTKQYINAKDVKIKEIKELKQKLEYGSCLEVKYDLKDAGLTYKTAANLAIFPENSAHDVDRAAKLLGLELDQIIHFEREIQHENPAQIKLPFPTPITVRDALTKFCDLTGELKKKTLTDLSKFAKNEAESAELALFAKKDGVEKFKEMTEEQTTILDIIKKYESLEIPLDEIFFLIPRMQPRYYTIASSSLKYPDEVHIAISLTEDLLKDYTIKKGVTSHYLESFFKSEDYKGKTNRIFIKDSLFHIPETSPILMIGPGTGVAPFIAYSQEREEWQAQGKTLPESTLIFGCRKSDSDYIYKSDMAKWKESGVITHLYEAFSREQENKVYVQDILAQQKDTILKQLQEDNLHVFMCGAMNMGKNVQKLIEDWLG